jgi:hypothetical protein
MTRRSRYRYVNGIQLSASYALVFGITTRF